MMIIESERSAAQNGRQFQITEEEFCAFLSVNLLIGINKLPTMKSYWSVRNGDLCDRYCEGQPKEYVSFEA